MKNYLPYSMMAALLLLLVYLVWYSVALPYFLDRKIVLDVETGALEIELDAEFSGKAFRNLWTCSRRNGNESEPAIKPSFPAGCPRTHVMSDERIATPTLPKGTSIEITSSSSHLRIQIVDIPERYDDRTEVVRLEGGAFILPSSSFGSFGTLPLTGKVRIGAAFSETDRLSTVSGRYLIRGRTPFGVMDGNLRDLGSGILLAGARTRFMSRDKKTASARVVIMLPGPKYADNASNRRIARSTKLFRCNVLFYRRSSDRTVLA